MAGLDNVCSTHKLDQLRFSLFEDLLALAARLVLSVPCDLDLAETLQDLVGLRSMRHFECFITLLACGLRDNC